MPSREEIAAKLFGLKPPDVLAALKGSTAAGPIGAGSADEAQRKMAAHVSTAILADVVAQFQKAWRTLGPGVLCIRRVTDDAIWCDVESVQQQLRLAEQDGDSDFAALQARVLARLEDLDPEQLVLLLITDSSSIRLLELPAIDPARGVRQLLGRWNG